MNDFYRNAGDRTEEYSLRGQEKPDVLIFTEGPTEAYFMERWLLSSHNDPKRIAVICFKGRRKLGAIFKKLMMEDNFQFVSGIGFFLDADTQPAISTVHSIQTLLQSVNLIPPGSKLKAGYQVIGQYKIAIYVSPNNSDPGIVENMVINEIADSNLHSCFQSFQHSVETKLGSSLHPKSIVQSYIGIRSPGTCGTGHGFNQEVLNVNHSAYSELRNVMVKIL